MLDFLPLKAERCGAEGAAPLAHQAGRDDQNRESETGGENPNHAEPPNAPSDEKPQPDGTTTPDGSATKHGTREPAANASDAHEPEPAPQKQEDEEEEGATPTGQADDGNEKSGAPTPPSSRTNATERAANEARDTPRGPANDATENTRTRDDGTAARTAASTPDAHPTNTRDAGASDAKHGARQASATEREPENPTTGADERAATTEEGKGDNITATTRPNPRRGGRQDGKPNSLAMIWFSVLPSGEHQSKPPKIGAALSPYSVGNRARKAATALAPENKVKGRAETTKEFFGVLFSFSTASRRKNCFGGAGSAALDFVLAARALFPCRAGARLRAQRLTPQARRAPGCPHAA